MFKNAIYFPIDVLTVSLDQCIVECCFSHGLPKKCLSEKLETKTTSEHNTTHMVVTTVMSKECHKYQKILKECKSGCIEKNKNSTKISDFKQTSKLRWNQ